MIKCLKIIALLLSFSFAASAQEKVEKYCEIQFVQKGFSIGDRINTYFSVGVVDSLFSFKDTAIILSLNKVKTFKTKVDVLNYMSAIKWSLVFFNENFLIFKRTFDKSELFAHK